MTRATIVFLVLLRLAIGWHFSFEGMEKYHSGTWSSEVYLRESNGPLSPLFHQLAGDPLAARLGLRAGDKAAYENMPPRLQEEWQGWFAGFASYYKLSPAQKEIAEASFKQSGDQFVHWLRTEKKSLDKPPSLPAGVTVSSEKSIAEWVAEYQKLQQEAWKLESELPQANEYSRKKLADRIKELKGDAGRIRSALQSDLDKQTKEMQDGVRAVLEPDQLARGRYSNSTKVGLLKRDLLGWADFLVPLGLVVIGSCLLLGLCTRTACVLGAVLLLSFYAAMPPLPGAPDNPKAEGHYLVINKNIVELLALLTLATTASGQWFGLDRGIQALKSRCCRKQTPAAPTPLTVIEVPAAPTIPGSTATEGDRPPRPNEPEA